MRRIHTIHHRACTGGTLFSKCLAAMPGVVLLSEVHPFAMVPGFQPFDPIQQFQLRGGNDLQFSEEELGDIFLKRVLRIYTKCQENGNSLVLRDHTYSDYVPFGVRRDRPLLRLLRQSYEVRSVVTFRNPVEAYLGVLEQGWQGPLRTFEAYCANLLLFLEDYQDCPVFLYEDLVGDPLKTMRSLCRALELPFDPEFLLRFSTITLSGDSGRGRSMTGVRRLPMRPLPDSVRQEALGSDSFQRICDRFGYERDPLETARQSAEALGNPGGQRVIRIEIH